MDIGKRTICRGPRGLFYVRKVITHLYQVSSILKRVWRKYSTSKRPLKIIFLLEIGFLVRIPLTGVFLCKGYLSEVFTLWNTFDSFYL